MTRTDYACDMSATPNDPPRINTKALETFMRAFDHAFQGKYGLGSVEPQTADAQAESELRELEQQVVKTVMARERAVPVEQRQARLRFWYRFPLLKNIGRLRDSIRLRKYNREWLKNNVH